MEMINRIAVVLTPRRRFFDWLNAMPDTETKLSYETRKEHRSVYLVAGEEDSTAEDLIVSNWEDLFTSELASWYPDSDEWPSNRTVHTFQDWFEVDVIDTVNDLDPEEPFTAAEQARTRCASCGAPLDETQVAVGLRQNEELVRWTADEMQEWAERDPEEDDPDDATRVLVALRCCSDECAEAVEEILGRAGEAAE